MRFASECGLPKGLKLLLRNRDATAWHGYHLEEPYALIGTAEDCNVRLSDESIAPFHAYLQMLDDRLFVCDLTERSGVMRDGLPLLTDWVEATADVQVGRYTLRIDAVGGEKAENGFLYHRPRRPADLMDDEDDRSDVRPLDLKGESRGPLLLSMRLSGGKVQRAQSQRDVSLVGRSDVCKFRLGSSSVANIHCSLVRTDDALWVVDLGSPGGTFLNGERIRRARAASGSRIQVGRCQLDVDMKSDLEKLHAMDDQPCTIIPFQESPPMPRHTGTGSPAVYSEQLIRDLVADVASSQQTAFEQARAMLMELVASQERTHNQQLQSLHAQNEQLLDVIRMLMKSHENQSSHAAGPAMELAGALATLPSAENQQPSPPPGRTESDLESHAGRPSETDKEIHNVWVRGQLHTISETLKKEQERGVKKLLRTLLPGRSDDALS